MSTVIPALRQARASSARPLKVVGSPSIRRTTRPPGWALAAWTTILAREACVSGCPCVPCEASTTSTSGRAWAATRRPGQLVGDDDVGALQRGHGREREQTGVARTRPDKGNRCRRRAEWAAEGLSGLTWSSDSSIAVVWACMPGLVPGSAVAAGWPLARGIECGRAAGRGPGAGRRAEAALDARLRGAVRQQQGGQSRRHHRVVGRTGDGTAQLQGAVAGADERPDGQFEGSNAPTTSASTPTGAMQPASRAASTVLSAVTQACVSGSSRAARTSKTTESSARHSRARAPCPAAGKTWIGSGTSVARSARPRRSRPARARTTASSSPVSTRARRVSTLPRIGTSRRPGPEPLAGPRGGRARADAGSGRQLAEGQAVAGHQDIPDVFANRGRGDDQAGFGRGRQVLERVDRGRYPRRARPAAARTRTRQCHRWSQGRPVGVTLGDDLDDRRRGRPRKASAICPDWVRARRLRRVPRRKAIMTPPARQPGRGRSRQPHPWGHQRSGRHRRPVRSRRRRRLRR